MRPILLLLILIVTSSGCAPARTAATVPDRAAEDLLAARVAEADRLASRGCYLCLKEAASAYALLDDVDDPSLSRKALENLLMIALREIELRIPDSGAREAASALQANVPSSYASYFDALDALSATGGVFAQPLRLRRERLEQTAIELEKQWPASPMKAYFYLAAAFGAGMVEQLKPQLEGILTTHSHDLSLKYRVQAFLPLFSEDASRALIGQETGFGEVHFLLGQRAVLDARLADAHRELTRARQLLPDSAAISLVLGNVMMAYARYPDALTLFDAILALPAEAASREQAEAQLGRAKALSYIGRHPDAIAILDELLNDVQNNPGEKYFWRSWNRLRLSQPQPAYEDALSALKAMRNNQVYRVAGMASFALGRFAEAQEYFEDALRMNGADCDAQRYLGQIDSLERSWQLALARFSNAVGCYDETIARMRKELAEHEKDITGLSNGLITTLRTDIAEAETLRANSAKNADLVRDAASIR